MFLGVQAALSVIALDLTMVVPLILSYLAYLVAFSKDMDLRHLVCDVIYTRDPFLWS
jgi:hypothetical protein